MRRPHLPLLLFPILAVALYMRSLASWRPRKVFEMPGRVSQLVFSKDGKTLLVGHAPGTSLPGRPMTTTLTALDVVHDFRLRWQRNKGLIFSNEPQFFDHDSRILLDGSASLTLDARTGKTHLQYGYPVHLAISPNGKWLASPEDGNAHLFIHPANRIFQDESSLAPTKIVGTSDQVMSEFAFSPDSQTLAVGVSDDKGTHLDLYNTTSWQLARTWSDSVFNTKGQAIYYQVVQWSPNGRFLFSAWEKPAGTMHLQVWRTSDGRKLAHSTLLCTFVGLPPQLQNDGRVLEHVHGIAKLSQSATTITNRKEVFSFPSDVVSAVAISPDGTYLVAGNFRGQVYRRRLK